MVRQDVCVANYKIRNWITAAQSNQLLKEKPQDSLTEISMNPISIISV